LKLLPRETVRASVAARPNAYAATLFESLQAPSHSRP
jgi:hypothetical protein